MLQDLLETEKSLEPTKQVSFKEETVLLINYDADEPPNTVTPKEMTPINCITPILKSSSSSVIPDIVPCEPDLDIFDEESYKDESDGASESEQEDEDIEIQGEEDPEPNSDTYSLNSDEKGSFFEQVTVEDYEDMDRLLDDLEKYMKKKPTVDTNVPHVQSIPSGSDDSSPSSIKAKKVDMIMSKLSEANVKKITTRIYIEDARTFKTLVLNSLMSSSAIVNAVVDSHRLEPSPDWVLFELCNDHGLERPIRDWETVTDIISAWNPTNSINAIVMKKYQYKSTISPQSISGRFPRIQGHLYFEKEPGKWQKRFFQLKDFNLFYFKESNNPQTETQILSLSSFDVYTLSRPRKKTPTQFCFALRSDMPSSSFKDHTEYCKFFCVEKAGRLFDWVLALRLAKSEKMYCDQPHIFAEYPEIEQNLQSATRASLKDTHHSAPNGSLIAKPSKKDESEEDDVPIGAIYKNIKKKKKKEKEGDVLKKEKSRKPKPLVDISQIRH